MSQAPATRSEPSLRLGLWLGAAATLARAVLVAALEISHHADRTMALLRLARAAGTLVLWGALLSVLAAGALAGSARRPALRIPAAALLAALLFGHLAGWLDADASLRVGGDTTPGRLALALAGTLALVLAGALLLGGTRALRARLARAWAVPLLAVLAPLAYLRLAHGGLGDTFTLVRVEEVLVTASWEILAAHPADGPRPGVLGPSARYSPEGAARPALVLPPPARVRRDLAAFDGVRVLTGAAGLDAAVQEAAAAHPGHAVRLRVRIDGALVSEAVLPLAGSERWVPFDGGGLEVHGGARVELESALLDPSGAEVTPAESLAAGFAELRVERRERRARAVASPEAPSIVLVLIDTLRADRTSAYGYARPTTPRLEALAARGTLWEEAHSTASWTWPSTASVLTGLYPPQHGVEDARTSFLPEALDTLPEALQRVGVTTAAWSGSPLIVPDKRFDQGFEFFDASRAGRMRRSDIVLPAALEWLETVGDRRFFLYLHLMEPHAPYVPLPPARARFAAEVPADYDTRRPVDHGWALQREGFDSSGQRRTESVVPPEEQRWISDLYDGSVWSADHYLGELLDRLDALGLAGTTVVAVTSDHGEELFDHGLLTHGHALHRELVRVPLVLAGPGVPQGTRIATPVSCAALGPTLARLGGSALEGLGPDSAAGLDLFAPEERATLFATRQGWWNGHARQPLFGLRKGTSVLHLAPEAAPWGGPNPGPGERRFYDLTSDPGEQHDLAREDPARARALEAELLGLLGTLERGRADSGVVPDEGTLEVLRALGYLGDERDQ